ncbi:MAG: TolC family protein [Bacteroidales bacterium]
MIRYGQFHCLDRFFVVTLLVFIATSPMLRAQVSPLTLEQCLLVALNENPLVEASHQQYQAALARVNQARALSQPTFGIDSDLQPKLLDFKGSGEMYMGIGKSVLFPGKRKINTSIALKESDQVLMEAEMVKIDLAYRVKQAFFNVLLSQEKYRYAEKNLELAQDFLEKTSIKLEAGDASRVEVIRAQVEAAKVAGEIQLIVNEVAKNKADLNFFLGRNAQSPLEVEKGLRLIYDLPSLDTLTTQALSNRPEITWTRYAMDREALIRKQAGLSYLPDLDLGIARHTITGEPGTWDVTVGIPIPLFYNQPVKGQMAEASANLRALQSELANLENSIRLEVEDAYRNALVARNLINLFDQEMMSQSEEVYELLLYSYQEGEINGIELIEARKTLIETRIAYVDAIYNYDAAIISIEKSIGRTFKAN